MLLAQFSVKQKDFSVLNLTYENSKKPDASAESKSTYILKMTEQHGSITIPTSLDRVSTALIAASVESINRVGPCCAKVILEKIEDIREARRKIIIDRAKEILHKWNIESMPSVDEVYKEISDTMKVGKVEKYGPEDLPAGPGLRRQQRNLCC